MRGWRRRGAIELAAQSIVLVVVLAGCAVSSPATVPRSVAAGTNALASATTIPPKVGNKPPAPHLVPVVVRPLPIGMKVDYQLGGAYPPAAGVGIVSRDSEDAPFTAGYTICYLNAFQSQPQDAALWKTTRAELLLRGSDGKPIADPGWPDEMLLDTSTAAKRSALTTIFGPQITTCKSRGFNAVELDNLDSWTRSKGLLTENDNLAFASSLVKVAHSAGLPVGQKNAAELGRIGKDVVGFNFAVAEECYFYSECSAYTSVYGNQVIDIEYSDELAVPFSKVCAASSTPKMTILRDRDLLTPGHAGYVYKSC
jgi:hypothetical protein